jgi:hypothetical protein
MEDELYIAGLSASVVFGGIEIESKGFAGSALDGNQSLFPLVQIDKHVE